MDSRYQIKPQLRSISEIGILNILGRIPRRLRRSAARGFANASYRALKGLPKLDHKINSSFTDWVIGEYNKLQAVSNSNIGGDPAINGSTAPTLAD